MPRHQRPFIVFKRKASKYWYVTINRTSGLPEKVCRNWQRKSFVNFPPELLAYSNPKSKPSAESAAMALIAFLKNAGGAPAKKDSIRVGEWLRLFTSAETSPKGARLIAKNRPYSVHSVDRLRGLYEAHMKDDPFMDMLMSEVESQDALAFMNRMGLRELQGRYKKLEEKPKMAGTETFAKLIKFVRMGFREYGIDRHGWYNPFSSIDAPTEIVYQERDCILEEEVVRLFQPGVLQEPMEVAVCAAMFLAGLRRAEIFALRKDDLDWGTPKITVRHAWQNFSYRRRKMGPTKSKAERDAPFDLVLQNAIKKLWEQNGQHEFVFSYADGTTPGPSWIKGRFKKWLDRACIELQGREIVPHSSRHSLASILEERGVSLRYIQDLLGHSDLKTTKRYLHSTDKTIRDIGRKIDAVMVEPEPKAASAPKIVQIAG
jgi:integrase/recombinase XerD